MEIIEDLCQLFNKAKRTDALEMTKPYKNDWDIEDNEVTDREFPKRRYLEKNERFEIKLIEGNQ